MTKAQKKVFDWLDGDYRNALWVSSVLEHSLNKQVKEGNNNNDEKELRGFIEDFDKAFVNKEE